MVELGYVYNLGAARMRASRSRTVGVIVPNLRNPFFAVLLAGIEAVMETAGLAVLLANSNEVVEKQNGFVRRMREHGVDGLIVCPAEGTERGLVEDAARWGIHLVQALRIVPDTVSDYASTDYRGGMVAATGHLIALGHRRIAFVSGNRRHSAQADRLEGFLAAMDGGGLDPLFVLELELTHAAARAAAPEIVSRPDAPTALICFNDVVGLGLHRGLSDLGVALGRDVSLIGFDDVAEADLVRPGLASVATEPFKVGESAARLLLRRISEPGADIRQEIEPTRFVPRSSCGPVMFKA